MTRPNRNKTRAIRERMEKTGENYTVAQRFVDANWTTIYGGSANEDSSCNDNTSYNAPDTSYSPPDSSSPSCGD